MHHSLGHSSAGERETIDLINLLVCQTVHDAMIGSGGGGRAGERNMSGAGAVARTEVDMILAEVAWVPGPRYHNLHVTPGTGHGRQYTIYPTLEHKWLWSVAR